MPDKKNFNEKDVRGFYRLLSHRYLTELRLLKEGEPPIFLIAKDEEDFVKKCKYWNGKKNVYAGLRDRRKDLNKLAEAEDIVGLQIVTLDIDPKRKPDTPSTDKELKGALKVAEIIRNWFLKNGYSPPIRAMTGNGTCLYFSLPYFRINKRNREKIILSLKKFEKNCKEKFKKILTENNCEIDRIFDLQRIGKVIGTMSVKGKHTKKRPWRLSYFIDEPKRIEDEKLLKNILNGEMIFKY